jgi:hypothetical protein
LAALLGQYLFVVAGYEWRVCWLHVLSSERPV